MSTVWEVFRMNKKIYADITGVVHEYHFTDSQSSMKSSGISLRSRQLMSNQQRHPSHPIHACFLHHPQSQFHTLGTHNRSLPKVELPLLCVNLSWLSCFSFFVPFLFFFFYFSICFRSLSSRFCSASSSFLRFSSCFDFICSTNSGSVMHTASWLTPLLVTPLSLGFSKTGCH